eukprot:TRINITY_DN1656_c0_g1_i1.p1 TRINITY_DN1656_c0_g1~~TRINITY_DN1656_c0_g1_i1.p1  ORF type:complete len:536 (+),score=135.59 TRINITY_DN1656_c0_g1_i1:95-1609(+)
MAAALLQTMTAGVSKGMISRASQQRLVRPGLAAAGLRPRQRRELSKWAFPEMYEQTRLPVDSAVSLPPDVYSDADYAAWEHSTIWKKQWFAVEHVQALQKAGDFVVAEVGSQSFIICRDNQGSINAFYNVCSHRGAKLCTKSGNKKRINCPYHHWSYNLKGKLVGAPFFERDNFDKKDHGLKPVKVEVQFGIIWLNLDLEAPGLLQSLGGAAKELVDYPFHEMDLVGQTEYRPECNWKVLVENFVEWYHIPAVHPALDKFSKPHYHVENQGEGKYVGFVTNPLKHTDTVCDLEHWNLAPGNEQLAAAAPRQFDPRDTAFFYHLFPNVSITVYPHSVYTLIMLPGKESSSTSYEKLSFMQHPDCRLATDDDETFERKREEVHAFVKNINDEDLTICESVQQGVQALSYNGGMFCPAHEWTTYRMQNFFADALTDPWEKIQQEKSNSRGGKPVDDATDKTDTALPEFIIPERVETPPLQQEWAAVSMASEVAVSGSGTAQMTNAQV